MLILYAYDTDSVLVEPIKTKSNTDVLRAYDVLYEILETALHASNLNIMDNEP